MIDTADFEGVILPAVLGPCQGPETVLGDGGYWTPEPNQVLMLEEQLQSVLVAAQQSPASIIEPARLEPYDPEFVFKALNRILTTLPETRRQYLGIEVDGHKTILVNAFPKEAEVLHPCWRNSLVPYWAVVDGGDQYWRILYDTRTGDLYDLEYNDL